MIDYHAAHKQVAELVRMGYVKTTRGPRDARILQPTMFGLIYALLLASHTQIRRIVMNHADSIPSIFYFLVLCSNAKLTHVFSKLIRLAAKHAFSSILLSGRKTADIDAKRGLYEDFIHLAFPILTLPPSKFLIGKMQADRDEMSKLIKEKTEELQNTLMRDTAIKKALSLYNAIVLFMLSHCSADRAHIIEQHFPQFKDLIQASRIVQDNMHIRNLVQRSIEAIGGKATLETFELFDTIIREAGPFRAASKDSTDLQAVDVHQT